MVFGMPSALFPAIALHRLGGDASTVGYLCAAPYAGALFGSVTALALPGFLRYDARSDSVPA